MSFADVLTPTLSRLRARYEQSPLPRFLGWWLGELRSLLPATWRQRLAVQEAELWLATAEAELRIERALAGSIEPVATLPLQPADELGERFATALGDNLSQLRRVLLLAPDDVLRRRLSLPAVARDKLRGMLAFELDRQTPFRADQVYFDFRVLAHAPDARQLPIELALVPKERVEQRLQALGPLAGELDAVDLPLAGSRLGCNFLPTERRRRRDQRGRWLNLGLVAAALLLIALGMAQLVDNRRAAIDQLQAEIAEQRTAARGVAQLRSQLDQAVEAANFLAMRKQSEPSMLKLLAQLSDVLPDTTYLERMHIGGGTLTISGLSDQAAGLIAQLQKAPMLHNPSLTGAINPDPRSGKDRFTITAELGTPPAEDAK